MNRRKALLYLATGLAGATAWRLKMFDKLKENPLSPRMPVVFIGHGSPMNAIATNAFTKTLGALSARLPQPKAILVVSAHWLSRGTWITAMKNPKTIHDFYGFPQELFDVRYPAPGSPDTARSIEAAIQKPVIQSDTETWGLDHGTWSVLRHLYPKAEIPVLQLSIDIEQPPEYHYELGRQLAALRDRGILILGSGNLVHNLQRIRWQPNPPAFDWAIEFDEWLKGQLVARDFSSVMHQFHQTEAGRLSVPSMDHYYPLHYVLGAAHKEDELRFEYEEIQNGSISMRSFSLGAP